MAAKKKTSSKETPKKKAPPPSRPLPLAELVGIVLTAGGLFLALALFSWAPGDPSLNSAGTERVANLGGIVGSWMADLTRQLLGMCGWLVPVGSVWLGVQLIRFGFFLPSPRPLFGLTLLTPSMAALCHMEWGTEPGAEASLAGGLLGDLVGGAALTWMGALGAWVVMAVVVLIALQIAIGFAIGPLVDRVVVMLATLVPGMARWAGGAAVAGASAAGRVVHGRVSAWREARAEEPEDGHDNPLYDEEEDPDAQEEEQPEEPTLSRPAPAAMKGGKAEARPDPKVSAAQAKAPTRPAADFDEEDGPEGLDDDDPMDDPEGDGDEDEQAPARSLEEAAAAFRARRMAAKGEGMGPRIIKSKEADTPSYVDPNLLAGNAQRNQVFQLPPLSLLQTPPKVATESVDEADLRASARLLEAKFRDYGVDGEVVEIHPGPIINMFEYAPAPGIKVSKIVGLANDLAMALKATRIRIVAPIPGKSAVGIEVPNRKRQTVYLRDVIAHEGFVSKDLRLPIAMGKDTEGIPFSADMAKMPHLLVAGATGTGKSVAVNSMILSLLFSRTPEEVRLILVDPKMLEFSLYNDIPHLLLPVVTNPKKAAQALGWAVDEMVRRYKMLARVGTRNIANYNQRVEKELERWAQFGGPPPDFVPWEDDSSETSAGPQPPKKLPYIVIIIDELADLMMVAAKEVQDHIVRLAQMARAAGIHLLLATQRPSVDVITGLIKANFPSRVSFQVSSKIDSRTILDTNGAENLLGMGDMLFLAPGTAKLLRLHGPFVSDEEVKAVSEFVKAQGKPQYEQSLIASTSIDEEEGEDGEGSKKNPEDYDEFYDQAVALVAETRQVSVSGIQRRLKIGYNRAARIVEVMEKEGVVSPADHTGKREVLVQSLSF